MIAAATAIGDADLGYVQDLNAADATYASSETTEATEYRDALNAGA